ncbi:hypothetical protein [Streptomyces sp. JV185]|uniref:hypothetical protein n=1 Tax=Streptomyces sp. JV185 TaxID=858638 RepID=UPI002E75CC22|nr:hypothetical protein [Streptomyces sp. JV185]
MKDVDEDWNPSWPPAWQRHYAVVRVMLAEETILGYVEPGVTVHGMDIGKWLARQRQPEVGRRCPTGSESAWRPSVSSRTRPSWKHPRSHPQRR